VLPHAHLSTWALLGVTVIIAHMGWVPDVFLYKSVSYTCLAPTSKVLQALKALQTSQRHSEHPY
jgi:hypothetical protein